VTDLGAPVGGGTVVLITGVMAAGKSTVAQLLAERLPRSMHLRGDLFRRLIVAGLQNTLPDGGADARAQLEARYRAAAAVADIYAGIGFTVVYQDVILEADLAAQVQRLRTRPMYVVVLLADVDVIEQREAARDKKGYDPWTVRELDEALRRRTPRTGLWIDTSRQTPSQTVAEIVRRIDDARIDA
jgi:predicted kinase